MGIQDIDRLIEIQNFTNTFPGYDFKIDRGNRDTGIFINDFGRVEREIPITKERVEWYFMQGYHLFVPDLLDYQNWKIIEYQEECKAGSKPKYNKKGHDEFSDEYKDSYYEAARFQQLKIWESDKNWLDKITEFLQ